MFTRNYINHSSEIIGGREAIVVSGLGEYNLTDTMECGQCFRHVRLVGGGEDAYTEPRAEKRRLDSVISNLGDNYSEYLTLVSNRLVFVGQRCPGELIFYGISEEFFLSDVVWYFALDADYGKIREEIKSRTESPVLHNFADMARGVVLLRQGLWETLFSFIISSNNNIPRIRKIIRKICAAYGTNLSEEAGLDECPVYGGERICEKCRECGICYSFPSAEQILAAPEKILPAKPGFRYRYLVSAAELVHSGEVALEKIMEEGRYENTVAELKKITGVGDKVASCVALFAFCNYEAFPVDVWIKRAIDEYFEGSLDVAALGEYAGIAQQYIFHSIRNLKKD